MIFKSHYIDEWLQVWRINDDPYHLQQIHVPTENYEVTLPFLIVGERSEF